MNIKQRFHSFFLSFLCTWPDILFIYTTHLHWLACCWNGICRDQHNTERAAAGLSRLTGTCFEQSCLTPPQSNRTSHSQPSSGSQKLNDRKGRKKNTRLLNINQADCSDPSLHAGLVGSRAAQRGRLGAAESFISPPSCLTGFESRCSGHSWWNPFTDVKTGSLGNTLH